MERVILHSDLNNFYASVECQKNPALQGQAVAVCGDAELRHGIVLAKNYIAKNFGIKTGDVIWEAKQKCKDLIVVPADFNSYLKISSCVRKIYQKYTNQIESFGIDECWLDVTDSINLFGSGKEIADQIRNTIKEELGITASIGVSWNKIFAKLGSDMKKPDATTVISQINFKDTIFNLPMEDLLFVGSATKKKLTRYNIKTIGDIANSSVEFLKNRFGKWGEYLWIFANGLDNSPVMLDDSHSLVKSIGNSTTTFRDLKNRTDVKMIVTILAESVAARLREQGLKGQVISIHIKDNNLKRYGKQKKIAKPTFVSGEITKIAMELFDECYAFETFIRNIGIQVSNLTITDIPLQADMFLLEEQQKSKAEKCEHVIDDLRKRFGTHIINKGITYLDNKLTGIDPKHENIIHPNSFLK